MAGKPRINSTASFSSISSMASSSSIISLSSCPDANALTDSLSTSAVEDSPSIESATASSPLSFKDLSKYFPKEIREKIYAAYFQPPKDRFVDPNDSVLYETIIALRDTDSELYEEIAYVGRRIPSIAQHVVLNQKYEKGRVAGFEGFPKQLMTTPDWLNVKYIVLKIVYYDCSVRQEILHPDVTQSIRISIPHEMGLAWSRIKALQNGNSCLVQLTKVRFDMMYDAAHRSMKDFDHVPEDVETAVHVDDFDNVATEDNLVMPLSELVACFPLAKNVWAEPIGPLINKRALQTIRAFNLTRRILHRCVPKEAQLNMATGLAAKGDDDKEDDFIWKKDEAGKEHDKLTVKRAVKYLRMIKKDDWLVKNEINFEILCLGCQAKFKGERATWHYPEEKCLTRGLFKEHCQRSTRNHGNSAPCDYRGRGEVELE